MRPRCWLIQRLHQPAHPVPQRFPCGSVRGEGKKGGRWEEGRGIMLSCTMAQQHTKNESQVSQEVLHLSTHEQDVSGLYCTAFLYYSSTLFFPLFFLFVARCWGVTFSLPHHQPYVSNNAILSSSANKPRLQVYQSELAALWYSLHSWSPFSSSTSRDLAVPKMTSH